MECCGGFCVQQQRLPHGLNCGFPQLRRILLVWHTLCYKKTLSFLVQVLYHRLTRANTPASAPLRRFLPFSPWRAPARLRIKSQKSLGNPSLAGGKQFCRAEMCPDKERPAGNTCCISKVLDAVWAHFCPSKPCLPLSIDGTILI